MTKYEKYVDDDNVYHYELTLENGSKHWVKKELGDYLHSLEQKVENLSLSGVSQQRELLLDFIEHIEKETAMWRIPIGDDEVDDYLANNCG